MKMTQRVPGHVLFCEAERLEWDVDRTEELVFLDTVVTPSRYLMGANTYITVEYLVDFFCFIIIIFLNYLQQTFLDIFKRHAVNQHFHKGRMNIATNNACFTLGDFVHVW